MKKLFAMILAAALMLSVCVASAASLADVQANGVLVMGTSPDFPPYENLEIDVMTGAQTYVGIEIDIMNKVAEKLGVTLDIKPVDFDAVLPGVQTGIYDIGVSGFTVTPERQESVLFSKVYYMEGIVIVVPEGSAIAGPNDLQGKLIAVQSGTTAEALCVEQGYTINAYKQNVDAELALINGSVDAWVIDKGVASRMVAAYNEEAMGAKLSMLAEPLTEEPYAFAFALGSDDLANAVNTVLEEMITSGEMAQIFADNGNDAYIAPEE